MNRKPVVGDKVCPKTFRPIVNRRTNTTYTMDENTIGIVTEVGRNHNVGISAMADDWAMKVCVVDTFDVITTFSSRWELVNDLQTERTR